MSISAGIQIECELCSRKISKANSEFFIYIPIEKQLRKLIDEHFDEICSNHTTNEDFIEDIHDAIQFQKAREKYKGATILSMVACTDGTQVFNSTNKSLWAIQMYLSFLKPSKRYFDK